MANISFVNNSGADISLVMPYFNQAMKDGFLHDDVADVFEIEILKGFNDDGSDRMIINFKGE